MTEDTWVNEQMKTNCVVFDRSRKEFMLITNGKCILDHSSPEAYEKAHDDCDGKVCGCKYRPYEAIVLRIIGFTKTRPIYGWSYITIPEDADLEPAPMNTEWFMRALHSRRTRYSLGRLKCNPII